MNATARQPRTAVSTLVRCSNGMATLGAVAERIATLSAHHHDKMVPTRQMHFPNGIESVVIGENEHPLREQAQRQLSARLGIPHPYLKRCPRGLQESQLNHWLRFEENETFFLRFDADEVRAVFTPRYRPIDNVSIIEELFSMGHDHATPVQARFDTEFMSIGIMDGRMTFDINGLGDRVTPGISVSNSEVGLAAVTVSAFLYRLVCSNGMIGITSASIRKRHISATMLEEFPSMLGEATKGLSGMRESFKLSLESPVADPSSTMERLNKQFLITADSEREAVTWGFEQEPGHTLFHIANAYTKGAQHSNLSAFSANRLERAGGQVLSMVRPQ